jgi:hypothetical protein
LAQSGRSPRLRGDRRHRPCSEFTAGSPMTRMFSGARLAQLAPFIRSCFIGRFIPRTDIIQNYRVGGGQTLNLRLVLCRKDRQPPPTFGIIYRAVTHDRTNFGQAGSVGDNWRCFCGRVPAPPIREAYPPSRHWPAADLAKVASTITRRSFPTMITIRPLASAAGAIGSVSATIIAGTKPACSA